MQPEISEFSYGFALTNELVGWAELTAAPIFPSLIEEGKAGGGYDVKLDRPGAPLFLQFKRSEYMERRNAHEFSAVQRSGGMLSCPFYRFPITLSTKSQQHELLLALDVSPNLVFYVAPKFHRISEINAAWHSSEVASRSIFITPTEIGSLDDKQHRIAFDATSAWVCSEPRAIEGLTSRQVVDRIKQQLKEDDRPLREKLPEVIKGLNDARVRGEGRIREKQQAARISDGMAVRRAVVEEDYDEAATVYRPEPTPPAMRAPRPLTEAEEQLRVAADIAVRDFEAQLVIVQPA